MKNCSLLIRPNVKDVPINVNMFCFTCIIKTILLIMIQSFYLNIFDLNRETKSPTKHFFKAKVNIEIFLKYFSYKRNYDPFITYVYISNVMLVLSCVI